MISRYEFPSVQQACIYQERIGADYGQNLSSQGDVLLLLLNKNQSLFVLSIIEGRVRLGRWVNSVVLCSICLARKSSFSPGEGR